MKYVLEVRNNQYCEGCCEDIFQCIRCDYSLLSLKPVENIDINELNVLAEQESDKCRSKQQDIDYHNDCVECYKAGFNKAFEMLCE